MIAVADFVARWPETGLVDAPAPPWVLTARIADILAAHLERLEGDYQLTGRIAVHASAVIEPGVTLKPPLVIGPGCLVGAGAYLRGGVFLEADCVVGPACEVKSSYLLRGTRLAHLSFVGDSLLGSEVNLEAGAVIANHRNEAADKRISIAWRGTVIETGVEKFGALVGDRVRIGANAVIAPGALLEPGSVVERLALVDQRPS